MAFPYLVPTPPRADGASRRLAVATAELAARAGLLYRLGYSEAQATARLAAAVAWEFDPPSARGPHARPAALSDAAIAQIVAATFARRPGG